MPFYQTLKVSGFGLPLPMAWICSIPPSGSRFGSVIGRGRLIFGSIGKITLKTRLLEDFKSVPIFFVPLALCEIFCWLGLFVRPDPADYTYGFFLGIFWLGFSLWFLYALRLFKGGHNIGLKKAFPPISIFFVLTTISGIF